MLLCSVWEKLSQTQVQSNSSDKALLPLVSDKMLPLRNRVLVVETDRQLWRRKPRLYPPNKEIWVRRRPRGCHWTSIRARSHVAKGFLTPIPASNYQCPALRWMNEQICFDRRQIISSSHVGDIWSVWFQFLPRLRNQVFEGMAYLSCSAKLLWSKVFPSLSFPRVALCWPDTSLCPFSPAHTKGFPFSSGHGFWLNHALLPSSN